jgi:PAS domain S-box-containing protein
MSSRREPSTKLAERFEAAQRRIADLEAEVEQARASELDLQRIAEHMRDLVSEVDGAGVYRYASPSYLRVLGYEPSSLIGRSILELVHPEDAARVESVLRGAAAEQEEEHRFRHADGHYIWVSTLSRVLLDSEGRVVGSVRSARDITERKRADDEIRLLHEELEARVAARTAELEAAHRELEAFACSVSHDLRAPLRSISGFASILEEEWTSRLPGDAARLLEGIKKAAVRMGTLIEALLSFSRLGRQPLHKSSVATATVVAEVIDSLGVQIAERQVEFVVGELPDCEGDAVLLRQVWANLLSNAVKFTQGRRQARVEVGSRERDGKTVYFVKDNGVGFDMRWAGKLFGVFQRLHSPDRYEGTGIGLANVHRIVTRHGGKVWAEAVPEAGATFSFNL